MRRCRASIDKKHLAGIVTLVARKGKVVQHKAYGMQDVEKQTPMRTDTIARIYSMTKPVAGVAMMMLYEEGKWKPSDPIAKHIPQFANLKVFAGEQDGQLILEDARTRADDGRVDVAHGGLHLRRCSGTRRWTSCIERRTRWPRRRCRRSSRRWRSCRWLYQPGTKWVYSVSVDIQGYLVEKLSGQTFPEFLRTRLFEPLGMIDTAFFVPVEKMPRVATIYGWNAKAGALAPQPHDAGINQPPGLPSGGGGLYGTAADYFRFAQMLLNGGELNGRRILKKASVDMMRSNVLSEQVLNSKSGIGPGAILAGAGFRL